jgi:hypothetical protein
LEKKISLKSIAIKRPWGSAGGVNYGGGQSVHPKPSGTDVVSSVRPIPHGIAKPAFFSNFGKTLVSSTSGASPGIARFYMSEFELANVRA